MRFVCALNAETALSGCTRTKNSVGASPFVSEPQKNTVFDPSLLRSSIPSSDPLSSDSQFHLPILSFLPLLRPSIPSFNPQKKNIFAPLFFSSQ